MAQALGLKGLVAAHRRNDEVRGERAHSTHELGVAL
eukprot:CAMPEP_0182858176 /NCGR_PEP_ID=MMETSP0034_2-20130328/3504_1 /TAXON_ID=156128 /ORGANISM="Nephroselmis pyriformis, Strain CCMP717" /LENGTH=35 /DNA_ID= /DNA_START= /DNA_END= /DNA_ORIENTATION=